MQTILLYIICPEIIMNLNSLPLFATISEKKIAMKISIAYSEFYLFYFTTVHIMQGPRASQFM